MEQNNESLLTRLNTWMKESVTLKLMSIGFLILLLLIPSSMITGLILERQQTNESVVRDVSADWSHRQSIKGPILVIPYVVHLEKGKETNHAVFLPDQLKINGIIMPDERKRGIYKVIVYSSDLKVSGEFSNINFSDWGIAADDVLLNEAYLITGISDLRGIKENIILKWDDNEFEFDTGFDNIASTK